MVRVLTIDVSNLWRLQNQHGLFLDTRADPNFLEMFSDFLHIEFSYSRDKQIGDARIIYPANKSHLENLLDQYFLIASYPDRERRLQEIFGPPIHEPSKEYFGEEHAFVAGALPDRHASWDDQALKEWLSEPIEGYASPRFVKLITIDVTTKDERTAKEQLTDMTSVL